MDRITKQPRSNGAGGLTGESYLGLTSFLAAASGHPAVRAIAPGDICADLHRAVFHAGAFALSTMGYWALAMDAPD